jgi:hypothetical protein
VWPASMAAWCFLAGDLLLSHPFLDIGEAVDNLGPDTQAPGSIGQVGGKKLLADAHECRRRPAIHVQGLGHLLGLFDSGFDVNGDNGQRNLQMVGPSVERATGDEVRVA